MKIWQYQKWLDFWKKLTSGSTNRQIFGAAVTVGIGTGFVKVASVGKELVVAWKFGTADDLDAFLIALVVPFLITTVIAGSFNAALIPTYIRVREQEGIKAAQKLFSGAIAWSLGLLGITTVLMLATAPLYLPKMAAGFSAEKLDLTYKLLCAIAPIILLSGTITIWGAVLNAGEKFALVAVAPIMTPTITMLFIFGINSWGVFSLASGLVCGQLLEMIVVGIALRRQGISLLPKWYGFDTHLSEVAGQYAPMIAAAFLMSSTNLVDQSMAAMLPSGSVASLNYGNRIIALPITIANTALSTAVIPYFSKMVAREDWTSVRHTLKQYLGLIFAFSIPLTGLIILFSEPIVQILLQRGSFTASDARLVAQIQAGYAFQIPFYIASVLVVRLISAMRYNQILMWGSAGNLIVNIGLNYLFMQWLGVSGIALSTSGVYLFSFLFLFCVAIQKLKQTEQNLQV
jgi:putative peptidoglycan lipid II flippase